MLICYPSEFERPDRDHFIHFDCTALIGYDKAVLMAKDEKHDWEHEPKLQQRLDRVCSDYKLAAKYFPEACPFLKHLDRTDHELYANLQVHDPTYFDYGSIMNYDSSYGQKDSTHFPMSKKFPAGYKPVLRYTRKDGSQYWADGEMITGGVYLSEAKRVSIMDIKRIAQLYPGTEEQKKAAAALRPSDSLAALPAKDMFESIAWPGQQIRQNIGKNFMVTSNFPDVVDRDLKPTVNPKLRWIRNFDDYCIQQERALGCNNKKYNLLDRATVEADRKTGEWTDEHQYQELSYPEVHGFI